MSFSKIQSAIYSMLDSEPYFAHFFLNSQIMYDVKGIETAAVTIIRGTPVIVFNTEFMDKLTVGQQKGVVKHEILHLTLNHLDDMRDVFHSRPELQKIMNIAQDCMINQYVGEDELPEFCVTLKKISELCGEPLEAYQTSRYYYEKMVKKVDETIEKIKAMGIKTLDDHNPGEGNPDLEGMEGSGPIFEAAIRSAMKQAATAAAGNVPSYVNKALAIEKEAELPWKQMLRNFVFSQVTNRSKATNRKINRRFELPVPGKRKIRSMTLGVCSDSSGSVSDAQYAAFGAEIQSIVKQIELTYHIHADCQVQRVDKIKGGKNFNFERHGGGGTAYQPAIDEAVRLGCNVIVYFGDFDTADTPKNPGVPFLWVGVGSSPPPGNFGKVTYLKGV